MALINEDTRITEANPPYGHFTPQMYLLQHFPAAWVPAIPPAVLGNLNFRTLYSGQIVNGLPAPNVGVVMRNIPDGGAVIVAMHPQQQNMFVICGVTSIHDFNGHGFNALNAVLGSFGHGLQILIMTVGSSPVAAQNRADYINWVQHKLGNDVNNATILDWATLGDTFAVLTANVNGQVRGSFGHC